RSAYRDGALELSGHPFSKLNFPASHLHGRQKLAIRKCVIPLRSAADADVTLHNVVIRSQVPIGKWPVDSIAIVTGRFEIQIAQTVALAAPNERSATHNSEPLPGKRLSW